MGLKCAIPTGLFPEIWMLLPTCHRYAIDFTSEKMRDKIQISSYC
jgi:hypothetical protein